MPGKRDARSTKELESFPTILLADLSGGWCSAVIIGLEEDKYHILRAQSWDEALHFAKTHSRPIHVLLADDSRDGNLLAETMRPYRPQTQVVFVSDQSNANPQESLDPGRAAAKIVELLRPSK